ncbi:unnamed protein product [Calicophoron daubneyi]
MHNGESFTFQFADPAGRVKQLEMRNSVKEMLQSLLPKFKDKAHSELKEKLRLLETNPDILALYKELVVTGILSSDEFWARPEFSNATFNAPMTSDQRKAQCKSDTSNTSSANSRSSVDQASATSQISRSFQLNDRPQTIGVPSYLLSDIKPEADGANGIKYNLTHETIDSIFRAYPTVRQRHRELVPDKLSESDFWIKFFQSHYFHRDRIQVPKEDIFSECATMDERQLQTEVRRSRRNRISAHLDLESLEDHDVGLGYGTGSNTDLDAPVNDAKTGSQDETSRSKPSANQLLLRRFNNHSILVLKSLSPSDIASGLAPVHPPESGNQSQTAAANQTATQPIKDRIYGPELVEDPEPPYFRLDLTSVTDYLEGPTSRERETVPTVPGSNEPSRPSARALSPSQLEQGLSKCKASLKAAYQVRRKPALPLLPALEAQRALADVSPGGCLLGGKSSDEIKSREDRADSLSSTARLPATGRPMRGSPGSHRQIHESASAGEDVDRGPALLNPEQSRELQLLYASGSELLRHFWACFPVTTHQLEEKLERIASSLTRFRATKVAHFAASLDQPLGNKNDSNLANSAVEASPSHKISYRSRVTSHLECMLDAAQQKYGEWKARQRK